MGDKIENSILCGANSYNQKFYYNDAEFGNIPEDVQNELHIMCVKFTEEVGGILTVEFDKDGNVIFRVSVDDGDYLFDDIECQLSIDKMQKDNIELLHQLELYYKIAILHEEIEDEDS